MKSSEIQLGDRIFVPETGSLFDRGGAPVELRHQATRVLQALAARPNEVVERAMIVEQIWENREGAEEGLVQCIADIRRALNDSDKTVVETIPRKGYRLVSAPASPQATVRNRRMIAAVAFICMLAALAFGLIWRGQSSVGIHTPVIAVLPFANLSPAEDSTAIGDALGDSIIATLARYSQFDVIAGQSSFRFRDANRDLREIGEVLGADYLVQGSQSFSGGQARIAIQLVDAKDGTLRMVDAFEIPIEDVLEANDDIAHRIANTIGGSVMASNARTPRRTGEIDALLLDNRARLLFQSGPSREKWLTALELQDRAIEEYPEVEWGYIGKALMLRTGVRFGWEEDATQSVLAEAEAAARKAIDLNPQNHMAHFALGRVLMQLGDVSGSIAALERARQLNPSSSLVLNGLGQSYIYADDALNLRDTIDRVAAIDPLPAVLTLWVRAWAQWQMGECEAARDTIDSIPSAPLEMNKLRAVIYVCVGDAAAAHRELAEYLDKRPDWSVAREVEANASNWTADGPRDKWIGALVAAGLPN